MSEAEILSLNKEIENITSGYCSNSSIKDVVFDLIVTKNVKFNDIRNKAIYSDFIKIKSKKRGYLICNIYEVLSEKYNISYAAIKHTVLSESKKG